ncbi:glycosyltransferase family 2 protein [Bryobacter aggregatus]|uniref:glycosyltransferase family 2 protein n=1 Tax=Bryobacter aggregatus TaxID=360054 RepID=UPI00068D7BD7|nr:glycosyltransferase family A protein [Bryobacter aggregatus]
MISVVIPAKNAERFLPVALASVDEQGHEDFEILVIDDHSTDGTAEIARRHPRTKLLTLEGKTGPGAARNLGIERAQGEFVAFLDADDVWTPYKTRVQTARLLAQPHLQGVLGRARWVAMGEGVLPRLRYETDEDLVPMYLFGAGLFRKSYLEQLGPIDEGLIYGEDQDFFMRVLESGEPILTLRDQVMEYRIHGQNMTTGMTQQSMNLVAVLRKSLARRKAAGIGALRTWKSLDEFATAMISVVIPAYNAEKTLGRAIESALGQTLAPLEVIVVDDGSSDGTAAVARSFGERVRLLVQPNGGVGAARNTGILASVGNQIGLLDSDDVWRPDKLEKQWAALTKAPYPELVFGQVEQVVDATGVVLGQQPGVNATGLLARRSVYERAGLYRPELKAGEFVDWYARAVEAGLKSVILPDVLAERRQRSDSMMGAKPALAREYLRVLKDSLDRRRKV